MTLPGRTSTGNDYRYGFQGQEKDDELKGPGNSINYTFRMHDPRVGRFFAVDPLTKQYPHYSPYQFSGNEVISSIELEGAEPDKVTKTNTDNRPQLKVVWKNPDINTPSTKTGLLGRIGSKLLRGGLILKAISEIYSSGHDVLSYDEIASRHFHDAESPDGFKKPNSLEELQSFIFEINYRESLTIPITYSETWDDEKDKSKKSEYFYRAMSMKEFVLTGGTIQQRYDDNDQEKGVPFVTSDLKYLLNPKSFILNKKNSKKYDIIVVYKVSEGTTTALNANPILQNNENDNERSVIRSKMELRPIKKIEKGTVNYGLPGANGDKYINSRVESLYVIPIIK